MGTQQASTFIWSEKDGKSELIINLLTIIICHGENIWKEKKKSFIYIESLYKIIVMTIIDPNQLYKIAIGQNSLKRARGR